MRCQTCAGQKTYRLNMRCSREAEALLAKKKLSQIEQDKALSIIQLIGISLLTLIVPVRNPCMI